MRSFAAVLGICITLGCASVGCINNKAPAGTDPNDRPQAEGRDRLKSSLGSLTSLPATNRKIQFVLRDRFLPDRLELVLVTTPIADSIRGRSSRLDLYKWSGNSYDLQDTIGIQSVFAPMTGNVDRNGLQDLLCYTHDSLGRNGLTVMTTDPDRSKWKYLFRIDTVVPVFYKLSDSTFGLIQYDSVVEWSFGKLYYPKRLYRITNGVYARRAYDSTWSRLIRYMRDSIYQSFQLEREQIRSRTGGLTIDESRKYLKALTSFVFFDPSWLHARTFLLSERNVMAGHVSGVVVGFIDQLLSLARVSPFVELSQTPEQEQLIILLSEFDHYLGRGDQLAASLILRRLSPVITDPLMIFRIVDLSSSPGVAFALVDAARDMLALHHSRNPYSAPVMRKMAQLDRRLGYEDSAQMHIRRSLMYDSTSQEAIDLRNTLPYF